MARAPHFDWKGTATGRQALCYILMYAQGKAGDKLLTASPGDFGISGDEMRKYVLERVPQLEAQHLEHTGQPLTARKMMGRLYNMFELLPDGRRKPSGEHPQVNEHLTGVWLRVSGEQLSLLTDVRDLELTQEDKSN